MINLRLAHPNMKKIILFFLLFILLRHDCFSQVNNISTKPDGGNSTGNILRISREALQNKIKGGWAGQTIGVTFGGPYEFRFEGTFIGDYQPLLWYDGYLKETMLNNPYLYDDLYMDLTFVDIIEKFGLDAPADSFANAFARAGYSLWHANQAARYNILHGIHPPMSGYWKNNPHADCIDYQIESDFSGLMSPGMPNAASAISDKIGHIMNYGDGWYGGVFVGAMYALAFTSDSIPFIISEGLKAIPPQSEFYQCISDVIRWHKKFPVDWKQTWLEVQKKWANDIGCPDGVFAPFDIDAKVNAAYVVMGLLYGGRNFTKTLEIATRCGQDADCNPSSAGGILGAVLGYDHIPAYWKMGLKEAESIPFKYTSMSLNSVYETGMKHALENIRRNGGTVTGNMIQIRKQVPKAVRFEKSFDGLYPVLKIPVKWSEDKTQIHFDFEGTGFVMKGDASKWDSHSEFVFNCELYVDDKLVESPQLPASFTGRRHELCWKYDLPKGKHTVLFKILNPSKEEEVKANEVIIYSEKPVDGLQNNQLKVNATVISPGGTQ
jgi:ADP-ribosylglycohydrolase